MTGTPRNLQLFLMDGTPNGPIKCTLANWTGVTYLIPRTDLHKVKERRHLRQTGIYLLFGQNDENDEWLVYIGQARERKNGNGILGRISEHLNEEKLKYWTHAIVLVTSNDAFGPTEISYLENAFYNMAVQADRYRTMNGNDPSPGKVTEEKQAELEEFTSYAKLVIGALGYKVFEPLDDKKALAAAPVPVPAGESGPEPLLHLESAGASGTGRQTSDGFVLLSGSTIRPSSTASCPKSTIEDRANYADRIDADHSLTKDILFSSPSRAACFLTGTSISGTTAWRSREGLTLKELENRELGPLSS